MTSITAILVDDERKSLSILKSKIEKFCPSIKIVAETESPNKALELIISLKPQLLFLDIAMPKMSGFDLLNQIEEPEFEIIFVTAFDQYAIQAIQHCAIGYLLKPIINENLINSVANATKNIKDKTALKKNSLLIENLKEKTAENRKIVVPSQEGLEFISIKEIIHLEGVKGYTKVYFLTKKPMLSSFSIGYFYKLLENLNFYLVHKSHIINTDYIERYLNEGYVQLIKDHKIPVSKSRKNDFLKSLCG